MVSLENIQAIPKSPEHYSSPRISFSMDFLDDKNLVSKNLIPNTKPIPENTDKGKSRAGDFEFLSNNFPNSQTMTTADELFFEGKLLPFWEIQHVEKLGRISLGKNSEEKMEEEIFEKQENNKTIKNTSDSNNNNTGGRVWFIDDDPSPRPPKCTVLWKELLRLKKQRAASSLSPCSSSSSSRSSTTFGDLPVIEEGKEGSGKREKHVKRIKKGLERTRSASIRIRPIVNAPVCSQGKSNGLAAPLFSLKKGKLEK